MTKIEYKFGEEIADADYNGEDHTLMAYYHSKSKCIKVSHYYQNSNFPVTSEIGPLPDLPKKISVAQGALENEFVIAVVYNTIRELRLFKVTIDVSEPEEGKEKKFKVIIHEDRPIFGVKTASILTLKEPKKIDKGEEEENQIVDTYLSILLYSTESSSN